MKKLLCILFFGMLFSQQYAIGGVPIQIIKTNDLGEVKSPANITAEVSNNTIVLMIDYSCGGADITVETPTGNIVASTYCPITSGYAEITIPTSGCYIIRITTSEAVYEGQLII